MALTGIISGTGSLSGTLSTRGTLSGAVSTPSVEGKITNPILHGLSAYEIAVQHGFDGTEEEWIASLTAPFATDTIPGIMKLYDYTGENIDGAMTQRAVTHEIRDNTPSALSADDLYEIILN